MNKAVSLISIFLLTGMSIFAQLGIKSDNTLPDPSAMLDVQSTTKGAVFPRMTRAQRTAIASPAEGLLVYCLDCAQSGDARLTMFSGGAWYSICIYDDFVCGNPITKNHIAGAVAPVTKTVTYGTITNVPGEPSKCWATKNLGANQQPNLVYDTSDAASGWFFQFNRKQGYTHTNIALIPAWTITNIMENSNWVTINDPCRIELGTTWRIPTQTEWNNVDGTGLWNNWVGAFASLLKLHAQGYLNEFNGALNSRGVEGCYWSSTQMEPGYASRLFFNASSSYTDVGSKAIGNTVRCVRD